MFEHIKEWHAKKRVRKIFERNVNKIIENLKLILISTNELQERIYGWQTFLQ